MLHFSVTSWTDGPKKITRMCSSYSTKTWKRYLDTSNNHWTASEYDSRLDISIQNLRGEIEKVCAFLGKTLSEDQLQQLTKHLHFDSVSKNTAINFIESNKDKQEACKFVRKGILCHPLYMNSTFSSFLFPFHEMCILVQVKRVTGRIISAPNWIVALKNGSKRVWTEAI